MADAFDRFIPDAQGFLTLLRAHNTRDWFTEHKPDYDGTVRAPALLLLDMMVPRLAKITGETVSTKLFRPQRDIRFSKDKTPYKDHCHMLWHAPADTPIGYYLGISPDYVRVGAGVMGFGKDGLDRWRAAVSGPQGTAISQVLGRLRGDGCAVSDPELVRVPPPYGKDHPAGDLLRHKSLTVWADLAPRQTDLPDALAERFAQFAPLCALLRPIT